MAGVGGTDAGGRRGRGRRRRPGARAAGTCCSAGPREARFGRPSPASPVVDSRALVPRRRGLDAPPTMMKLDLRARPAAAREGAGAPAPPPVHARAAGDLLTLPPPGSSGLPPHPLLHGRRRPPHLGCAGCCSSSASRPCTSSPHRTREAEQDCGLDARAPAEAWMRRHVSAGEVSRGGTPASR
jgi:hypothetical protein